MTTYTKTNTSVTQISTETSTVLFPGCSQACSNTVVKCRGTTDLDNGQFCFILCCYPINLYNWYFWAQAGLPTKLSVVIPNYCSLLQGVSFHTPQLTDSTSAWLPPPHSRLTHNHSKVALKSSTLNIFVTATSHFWKASYPLHFLSLI